MKIIVADRVVTPKALTFSQVGFGKELEALSTRYVIELERGEFLNALVDSYDDCVSELRRDDEITGEFEPPYPGATDYPNIFDFFDIGGGPFFSFIRAHLKFDLLKKLFTEENAVAGFAIASLEGMEIDEDKKVRLFGLVRPLNGLPPTPGSGLD